MSFQGHLNKTIKIKEEVAGAADGMGGTAAPIWSTIHKQVKAAIVLIPKKEQIIQYDKIDVFAEFFIYLEHLSGVREGQEVHYGSRKFAIKLVLPWREKGRFMKLACVEIARAI